MSGQSNGQIALEIVGAVAGAVIGFYTPIGPVAGAQLGFVLGGVAGGTLFPPKPTEGPHLGDFQFSTSTYGTPIPINYGTTRLPGNLIWDGGFDETAQTVGPKKQEQIIYKAQRSFAFAFCRGEADILRIWMDGKLWFDATAGDLIGEDLTIPGPVRDRGIFGGVQRLTEYGVSLLLGGRSKNFTFYRGSETQEQDPTMVAALGADLVPAYRGLCYIVFTDFALEKFGNRIPTIQAELTSNPVDGCPKTPWVLDSDCPLRQVQQDEVGWDPKRGRVYEHDATDAAPDERGLRIFTYPDMVEDSWRTDADLFPPAYAVQVTAHITGTGHPQTGSFYNRTQGKPQAAQPFASAYWSFVLPLCFDSTGRQRTTADLNDLLTGFRNRLQSYFSGGETFAVVTSADEISLASESYLILGTLVCTSGNSPTPDVGDRSNVVTGDVIEVRSFSHANEYAIRAGCLSVVTSRPELEDYYYAPGVYYLGEGTLYEGANTSALPCDDCATCDVPNYELRGVSPKGYLYLVRDDTIVTLIDPERMTQAGSFQPSQTIRRMGFAVDQYGQTFPLGCSADGWMMVFDEASILSGGGCSPADVKEIASLQTAEPACVGAIGVTVHQAPLIEVCAGFFVGLSSTVMTIYRADITSTDAGLVDPLVSFSTVGSLTLLDEFPELGGAPDVKVVGYDGSDHMLVLIVQKVSVGYYLVKLDIFDILGIGSGLIRWKKFVPIVGVSYDPSYTIADISARTFGVGKGSAAGSPSDGAFILHRLNDGEPLSQHPFSCFPEGTDVVDAQQFYDSKLRAVYVSEATGSPTNVAGLHFLGRIAGDSIPLSDIVGDISQRCGLEPVDYDVSQLTDKVHGYAFTGGDGRSGIEPLMAGHFFDAVESDFIVKFPKRGGAIVATIPADDLATTSDGDTLTETRTQEVDVPERVNVNYSDYYHDYNKGSQHSKRIALPVPSQYSRDQLTIELPIAMSPTRAKRIADVTLDERWTGRFGFGFKTAQKYLALDPTDPVMVVAADGYSVRMRLAKADIGADLACELSGVEDDASVYSSEVVGIEGFGASPVVPGVGGDVEPLILDATLLRDSDDGGGSTSRYYQALRPLNPDAFEGGGVLRSLDGAGYELRGQFTTTPAMGQLETALADEPAPFTIHPDASFDVRMVYGAVPTSVSQLEFLAGRNTAAVIRSDGEVEWVMFRDAVEISEGLVRCSYLLRGRRGSEVFCADHEIGNRVVFVSTAMGVDSIELGALGRSISFEAVAPGQDLEDANKIIVKIDGNDLKPYAPVHLELDYDIGGSTISWQRRTRLGGGWRDGVGTVPVAEHSLAFEVDVFDEDGEVVRTLTTTSTSVPYTAAQASEDFPDGLPEELTFTVYQMSDSVGRGFGAAATLPFAPP